MPLTPFPVEDKHKACLWQGWPKGALEQMLHSSVIVGKKGTHFLKTEARMSKASIR